MIRLDYARPDEVYSVRVLAKMLRTPAARRVITAFATAAAFVVLLWGAEVWRLNNANALLVSLEDRYRIVAAQRKDTEALVGRLSVLTQLKAEIADVRVSGEERAAEIVDIGNRLPAGVSLESLQPDANEWHLSGHAASLEQVGHAIEALQQLSVTSQPHLREVHEESDSKVGYDLEVGRVEAK